MPLTHQRYIDYMTHGLGKIPDPRHLLAETLNDAGRAVFTAGQSAPYYHRWSWLVKENTQLFIPKTSDFAELPADFGSILAVEEEQRVVGSVQLTGIAHILQLRADITVSPLTLWLAFDVGGIQQNKNSPPIKHVAVYPQQDSDRTDIRMSYSRTWVNLDFDATTGALKDPNAVPNIPPEWERLLKLNAMRFALEIENETTSSYEEMFAKELQRLVSFDSSRQSIYGRPLHSVIDRAKGSRGYQYPHRGITRP